MRTLLLSAVYQNKSALVMRLLKKTPLAILLIKDFSGQTIAHKLAEAGMLEGLLYLEKNPDTKILLSQVDKEQCTPLRIAVLNNHKEIVAYLIDNRYDDFVAQIHKAVFFGELDKIEDFYQNNLLPLKDLDLKVYDARLTEIMGYAVLGGQIEIIQFLIKNYFSSNILVYSTLIDMAVRLHHFSIVHILLKKTNYTEVIRNIPKIAETLAKNKSSLGIPKILTELALDQLVPEKNGYSYFPYFITGAILYNSLELFSCLIKTFLKEKKFLSSSKKIENICYLITERKRSHFVPALAKEVFPLLEESPEIAAQCCSYFIAKSDDISLAIFIKTFQSISLNSIETLIHKVIKSHNFIKNGNIKILAILKNYFTTQPDQHKNSGNYYFKYIEFIESVHSIMETTKASVETYSQTSQNLRSCCEMLPANETSFLETAIGLLFETFETQAKLLSLNWDLLKQIFLDIKYLIFHEKFSNRKVYLSYLLQLTFIFSDYTMLDMCINQLLDDKQYQKEQDFCLRSVHFFILKLYTIIFSKINFFPSNEIKKLLLNEYIETSQSPPTIIDGISLFMLLKNINLNQKISGNISEKLEEIKIGNIEIGYPRISQELEKNVGQVLHLLYCTLYLLKEWVENLTITQGDTSNFQKNTNDNDVEKFFGYQLNFLHSYKICYYFKALLLEKIVELVEVLKKFNRNTFIIEISEDKNNQKKVFFCSKNFPEMEFSDLEIYQNSLIQAQDDLSQLSAACLITEENLEKITKETNRLKAINLAKKISERTEKTTKFPTKIESKTKTSPLTSANRHPSIAFEIEKIDPNKKPWKQVRHKKNKKKFSPPKKNFLYQKFDKTPSQITQTQSIKNVNRLSATQFKNHFYTENSTRNWDALKTFLYTKTETKLKILPDLTLHEWGFSINFPSILRGFFARFKPNQLFLVGGAIRNSLMRAEINDFDFVALLSSDGIKTMFPHAKTQGKGKKTILSIAYQRYTVDVLPLENSSYREALMRDSLEHNAVIALLQCDYQQRDFTINALYWNPYMGMVDISGGMIDLLFNRTLVPIQAGSRHFEVQHAIRILRGIRFAAQFHLIITKAMRELMEKNTSFLYTVHAEKLQKECQSLIKIVGETQAYQLYHSYCPHALLSRRIPLEMPTWNDFLSDDTTSSSFENRTNELSHISERIQKYLPENSLRALKCLSKNRFLLFTPQEDKECIKFQNTNLHPSDLKIRTNASEVTSTLKLS